MSQKVKINYCSRLDSNTKCVYLISDIVELVKRIPGPSEEPFRPNLELLLRSENGCCDDYVLQCMKDCWSENPEIRPDFATIRTRLKQLKDGK